MWEGWAGWAKALKPCGWATAVLLGPRVGNLQAAAKQAVPAVVHWLVEGMDSRLDQIQLQAAGVCWAGRGRQVGSLENLVCSIGQAAALAAAQQAVAHPGSWPFADFVAGV